MISVPECDKRFFVRNRKAKGKEEMIGKAKSSTLKLVLVSIITSFLFQVSASVRVEECRNRILHSLANLELIVEHYHLGLISDSEFDELVRRSDDRVFRQFLDCRREQRTKRPSYLGIIEYDHDQYMEFYRLNQEYRSVRDELLHGTERVD